MRNDLEEIKKIVLGEKKKQCYSKVIFAGIGIALIAAIAGTVWYFFFKDKSSDDDWDNDDWDDDDFDDDDDDCDCDDCNDEINSDDFVIEHDDQDEEKNI